MTVTGLQTASCAFRALVQHCAVLTSSLSVSGLLPSVSMLQCSACGCASPSCRSPARGGLVSSAARRRYRWLALRIPPRLSCRCAPARSGSVCSAASRWPLACSACGSLRLRRLALVLL